MLMPHWLALCSHSGSRSVGFFGSHGGIRCARSSVVPAAAIAQRDGISQANCSRPGDPYTWKSTPVKTTWMIANMTSSGMVFSAVLTSEEMTRPNIIEVKPSAMIERQISTAGGMISPSAGRSRVAKPMAQMITPWKAVITPRTITLDIRYAERERPVARSRS